MRAKLVCSIAATLLFAVCGVSNVSAQNTASKPVATSSVPPGGGVELWQLRFASQGECVQARTGATPAWPKFLAEAICKDTQYGNAVPPDYYTQGPCEIRQKDRKMGGVIKRSGYNAFEPYCANTHAEKYAHGNIKLE